MSAGSAQARSRLKLPEIKSLKVEALTSHARAVATGHTMAYHATPLLRARNWPLSQHYVYLDWDLGKTVEFNLEPLWTDEGGYLHQLEDESRVGPRLDWLKFKPPAEGSPGVVEWSLVLLFDRTMDGLEQKLARFRAGSLPAVKVESFTPGEQIVIPLDAAFQSEAEEVMGTGMHLLRKVEDATKALGQCLVEPVGVKRTVPRGELLIRWDDIDRWMDGHYGKAEIEERLTRPGPGKQSFWALDCSRSKSERVRYSERLREARDALWDFMHDSRTASYLAEIDLYESTAGGRVLWRDQFLFRACALLAAGEFRSRAFEEFVLGILSTYGAPAEAMRKACTCPSCRTLKGATREAPAHRIEGAPALSESLESAATSVETLNRAFEMVKLYTGEFPMAILEHKLDTEHLAGAVANFARRAGVPEARTRELFDRGLGVLKAALDPTLDPGAHLNELEELKVHTESLQFVGDLLGAVGYAVAVAKFVSSEHHKSSEYAGLAGGTVGAAELTARRVLKVPPKSHLFKWLGIGGAALGALSSNLDLYEKAGVINGPDGKPCDPDGFEYTLISTFGADIGVGVAVGNAFVAADVAAAAAAGVTVSASTALAAAALGCLSVAGLGLLIVGGICALAFAKGEEEKWLSDQGYLHD